MGDLGRHFATARRRDAWPTSVTRRRPEPARRRRRPAVPVRVAGGLAAVPGHVGPLDGHPRRRRSPTSRSSPRPGGATSTASRSRARSPTSWPARSRPVRPRRLLLSHHDDWLPGFSVATDMAPLRAADRGRGARHRAARARATSPPPTSSPGSDRCDPPSRCASVEPCSTSTAASVMPTPVRPCASGSSCRRCTRSARTRRSACKRDLELIEHLDAPRLRRGVDRRAPLRAASRRSPRPRCSSPPPPSARQRIKLGTGVNSLPYHHPLILADRIVMLDHLTEGPHDVRRRARASSRPTPRCSASTPTSSGG